MQPSARTVERKLAIIAGAAHGVVTRRELLLSGITVAQIKSRLSSGALLREHAGVYRVGHQAPSIEARYLAAVRACGEGALLSGPAAGYLLGLLRGSQPVPEVTAPAERKVEGIRTRRSRHMDARDATIVSGIPVTTVPRTLVDLASRLRSDDLARACHEAGVRYRTTPSQVERVLARRPTTSGSAKLRAVLRGDVRVTLSHLEGSFLTLLRDNRLPLPRVNRPVGGRRIDCHWPRRRLTVELDGYRYHNSRHAWEQDRRREREARGRGEGFRRFTYGDVLDDPWYLLKELRALLSDCPD